MKNYYNVLGIDSNASQENIRQAYKELVLKYHPDKCNDGNKFQQIQEAYECLSNEQNRAQYDTELHMNTMDPQLDGINNILLHMFGLRKPTTYPVKDANIYITRNISLMDVCKETEMQGTYDHEVIIDRFGYVVNSLIENIHWAVCNQCGGSGEIIKFINPLIIQHGTCSYCHANGYVLIDGYRIVIKTDVYKYKLPFGVQDGQTIILQNYGHIVYNKNNKQFNTGNIAITLEYDLSETNKIFQKINPYITINDVHMGDIEYTYNANIFEFMTGTEFDLPLPSGEYISINVSNLASNVFIPNKGLPQLFNKDVLYGNIHIFFKLRHLDEVMNIPEFEKINLKRIMRDYYPKTSHTNVIYL